MLTEVRKVKVSGAEIALDMYKRKQISKEKFGVLKASPRAAVKVDMYTVIPETVIGWTKYARPADIYENQEQYVSDIEVEYTTRNYMR